MSKKGLAYIHTLFFINDLPNIPTFLNLVCTLRKMQYNDSKRDSVRCSVFMSLTHRALDWNLV